MSQTTYIGYTIPAGGSIEPLINTQMEFFGAAGIMTLYAASSLGGDSVHIYIFGPTGPLEILPTSVLPVMSSPNLVKNNENFVGQFAIPASSRLKLVVTGAAGHTGILQFIVGATDGVPGL